MTGKIEMMWNKLFPLFYLNIDCSVTVGKREIVEERQREGENEREIVLWTLASTGSCFTFNRSGKSSGDTKNELALVLFIPLY